MFALQRRADDQDVRLEKSREMITKLLIEQVGNLFFSIISIIFGNVHDLVANGTQTAEGKMYGE